MESISIVMVKCADLTLSATGVADILSPERRKKIERLIRADDIAMSIGAEIALRCTLQNIGITFSDDPYFYDTNGKPQLKGNIGHISLSHSGGFAVCAFSDIPVGTDIEVLRIISASIVKRILSPQESCIPFDDKSLLVKWTIKESYLKLTGEGISGFPMNHLTADNGVIFRDNNPVAYYHYVISDDPAYYLSVCTGKPADISIKCLSADEAMSNLIL